MALRVQCSGQNLKGEMMIRGGVGEGGMVSLGWGGTIQSGGSPILGERLSSLMRISPPPLGTYTILPYHSKEHSGERGRRRLNRDSFPPRSFLPPQSRGKLKMVKMSFPRQPGPHLPALHPMHADQGALQAAGQRHQAQQLLFGSPRRLLLLTDGRITAPVSISPQ